MSRYAVTVEFDVRPGAIDAFLRLITENARVSVRDEPGCRQFDVMLPRNAASKVFLYEVYDDEAAFAAHTRTAHFAAFDRDSAPLVVSKNVRTADTHFESAKGR